MNNRQCVEDIAVDGNRFSGEIVRHKDDADTKVLLQRLRTYSVPKYMP